MMFFDLHCDTLLTLRKENCGLDTAPGHIDLQKLREGGAMLQCFAAFIPMNEIAREQGIADAPWDFFLAQASLFERETVRFPDILRPVRRAADIKENRERGLISAMLSVEDAACLEGELSRLHTMYELGVRMISLTWNYENCLGFPNSPDPALHGRGLKDFGFEALDEMGKLGVVVDVSHLSEGGFWDVARQNKKPFVASHSCARSLCDHSRNLTDEQLRALGDAGGVCGVNFCASFLRQNAEHSKNEDILRHMAHIADKAGIEAVALGSDFDGISCTLEMGDYSGLPALAERMADRFGTDAAERIWYKNALRVFTDVMD